MSGESTSTPSACHGDGVPLYTILLNLVLREALWTIMHVHNNYAVRKEIPN